MQPARFGGASGYVQFVAPAGRHVPAARADAAIAPDRADGRSPRAAAESSSATARVDGTHLRVLTRAGGSAGGGSRGAVMVARPLTEVDHELNRFC